ncbi:MAG TPA: lipopolysaccharide heptosyltransferase II [Pyrinomonadaceae bacterium]|nr:lipopolysaccharide heptosyltransferase II [Pyrinomonadaceae bacterium]
MKIVARGTNWVGDAVMTIPALRELRRIFPESKITLHTRSWAKGIFEDADFIDEILTFEPEKPAFKTVLAQAKVLQNGAFDLAVILPNSFESALAAKLGNVKKRFGYAKDARSFLLTDALKIPDWKNRKHEVFYYLNLIAEIEDRYFGTKSISENEPRFDLTVSQNRKSEARKMLAENGVDLTKKIVALCPGSTNSRAKRWQTTSYAALNDKIQTELKANVVLIGAPNELNVSNEIAEKSKLKPFVLTGKTNLSEATAILSVCDLLVSNDTGPAHISAALGTKTLVIFGPTNPLTTKPWNASIVRNNVECSPCMLRDCPIDHRCMTWISAEEIFAKAVSMIYDKTPN